MVNGQKGRRRGLVSWFVEPYRQVKLGMIFLVLNLMFSILIFSVFGFYIWDVYHALTTYFQLTPDQGAEILNKLRVPVLVAFGLIAVFVCATILTSVRYTHEIYGPLVSIYRYLDGLVESKKQAPLQLRPSDQLQDLAKKLNALEKLIFIGSREAWAEVLQFLEDLQNGATPSPLKLEGSEELHVLTEKLNQLATSIKEVS